MASTKEIKAHITGIKNTQKITNAMKLISTTKLRRTRSELEKTRPFFDALRLELTRIFYINKDIKSPYYSSEAGDGEDGPRGILLISSDKGLAGAYNYNVFHEAEKLLETHEDYKLFIVGETGRSYFAGRGLKYETDFRYSAQNPSLRLSRRIGAELLKRFSDYGLKSLYVVYTDFKNVINVAPTAVKLLPLTEEAFRDEQADTEMDFVYVPSPKAVLESIIPAYVNGFIYGALVDSFCSEQSARMTAMDNANQNADEILERLSKQYNHVRQNGITQEITEVSAGARWRERNSKQEEHL